MLAELVCSNSLKSDEPSNAHGLLKAELRLMGSLIVSAAERCSVPAGKALAVDRSMFAEEVTARLSAHPNLRVVPGEVGEIPGTPAIVATGPLTSDAMSAALAGLLGSEGLFFFDAIAPIVSAESLDASKMFSATRYGGEGDYLNAPLNRESYYKLIDELLSARRHPPHGFEEGRYFEGCLPVEVVAERGRDSLRFGLMKPVGITDPATGKRPFAVVQLRREDRAGTMHNLVGFQTQLAREEQRRVFRMLPGLERAEFLRYGSMHRNTYIDSPHVLSETMEARGRPGVFIAGQLCGVEGYVESAASGLVAGINCWRHMHGEPLLVPPMETMIGALCRYVAAGPVSGHFQPMNANFGLLPELPHRFRDKRQKGAAFAERSLVRLGEWLSSELVG
jgi:methylenetetrahydrofolate--tRNA-(uracil-5-)-methyltransferase